MCSYTFTVLQDLHSDGAIERSCRVMIEPSRLAVIRVSVEIVSVSGEGDLVLAGRQSGGCKTQMVSIKGLSLNDKLGLLPPVISRVTTSEQ